MNIKGHNNEKSKHLYIQLNPTPPILKIHWSRLEITIQSLLRPRALEITFEILASLNSHIQIGHRHVESLLSSQSVSRGHLFHLVHTQGLSTGYALFHGSDFGQIPFLLYYSALKFKQFKSWSESHNDYQIPWRGSWNPWRGHRPLLLMAAPTGNKQMFICISMMIFGFFRRDGIQSNQFQ